ncbi:hypothetical protein ACFONG_00480 [Uliginosibacterium paludis]|uniref:Lipoprotein n=1 Tax=Uliginosibacterium paludis TaxID=1615952 RepID=A0ABV2CRH2_9RHOO
MKSLLALSALLSLLAGCAVHGHSRTVLIDPVGAHEHPAHEHDHGRAHEGDFCPPGQAKKGRC